MDAPYGRLVSLSWGCVLHKARRPKAPRPEALNWQVMEGIWRRVRRAAFVVALIEALKARSPLKEPYSDYSGPLWRFRLMLVCDHGNIVFM